MVRRDVRRHKQPRQRFELAGLDARWLHLVPAPHRGGAHRLALYASASRMLTISTVITSRTRRTAERRSRGSIRGTANRSSLTHSDPASMGLSRERVVRRPLHHLLPRTRPVPHHPVGDRRRRSQSQGNLQRSRRPRPGPSPLATATRGELRRRRSTQALSFSLNACSSHLTPHYYTI